MGFWARTCGKNLLDPGSLARKDGWMDKVVLRVFHLNLFDAKIYLLPPLPQSCCHERPGASASEA